MGQRLGQHFLKNKTAIKKIVSAINPKRGELIIEIGPGRGALTFDIAENAKKAGADFVAIERDETLALALKDKLGGEIITGNVLIALAKIISESKTSNYKIVGNIPYYITGRLLRVVGELNPRPKKTVLMIQREVAERVSAGPGKMNLLAASVQIWGEVDILFNLPASDFSPPPKVNSAVISIKTKDDLPKNLDDYYAFIKKLFSQPRKTVLNNLASNLDLKKEGIAKAIESMGLDLKIRPQNLDLAQILKLQMRLKGGSDS